MVCLVKPMGCVVVPQIYHDYHGKEYMHHVSPLVRHGVNNGNPWDIYIVAMAHKRKCMMTNYMRE